MAHRLSYAMFNGDIPPGMVVCHKCDNPGCVNPDHLFVGTTQDNTRDMVNKRRHVFGEKSPRAKLTDSSVRLARELRKAGVGLRKLARYFGVAHPVLYNAITGKKWSHVK